MATNHGFEAARRLLESIRLRDKGWKPRSIAHPASLVCLSTKDHVEDAIKTLAQHNILSAPVVDAATGEYAGIVDALDVAFATLDAAYPELLDAGALAAHRRTSIAELQSLGAALGRRPVADAMHRGDAWYKGDAAATLAAVVRDGFRVGAPRAAGGRVVRHSLRVHHRVAVFEIVPGEQTPDGPIPEWRVVDVVSQSDVVALLAARLEAGALAGDAGFAAPLADLGLVQGAGAVVTAPASEPALAALARMRAAGVSAVGVTDEAGALAATLSVADLRGLALDRFGSLALPAGAFLLLRRGALAWGDALLERLPPAAAAGRWREALAAGGAPPPAAVAPGAPLADVVRLMAARGLHRVDIVDGDNRPVGVVTPTDVLRLVIQG